MILRLKCSKRTGYANKFHRNNRTFAAFQLNLCMFFSSSLQAAAVFNFLNADSRYVAGAFLPPKKDTPDELRFLIEQKRKKAIYGNKGMDFEKKVIPDSRSTAPSLKRK